MRFKGNILANEKRISLYNPLQSHLLLFPCFYNRNLNSNIRLKKCIVHICNCTIPVTWRGELKREQNDSFEKLRSSAENVA